MPAALAAAKISGTFDDIGKPVPRNILELAGMELGVIGHTMLVGVSTRRHGGVAGIGDRGINGLDSLDTRALGIHLLEARAGLQQVQNVLIDHRVAGKNDYFAV